MNKMEYLSKLKSCLSALPRKEREAALKYYDDLFKDAGYMNEQSVISGLGSPQSLAHTILNDNNGISYEFNKTKKRVKAVRKKMTPKQTAVVILLLVLTSPLWIGLLAIIFGVILGFFISVAALLIASAIFGIVLICMGFAYFAKTVSIALALCGIGISLASISVIVFTPVMNLVILLIKKIIKSLICLFNKIIRKNGV